MLEHVTIPSGGVLPKIRPELIGRKHGHLFPNEVSSKLVHASPKPQKVKTPTKVSTPRKKIAKKAKVKTTKKSVSKALAVATAATPSVLLKKVVQISWLYLKAYFFLLQAKSLTRCWMKLAGILCLVVFRSLQKSSLTSGGIDSATGFTILSEKTLFLGQKVR